MLANKNRAQSSLTSPLTWAVFILYLVVLAFAISRHEMWGDELHSWNIAKASKSFLDLISNTRYEGHPPVWYAILWSISKVTHELAYVQLVHGIIAALIVFIVLFFSPFSFLTKILIPFGYYFFYEYAVLSRNYAIGVLFVLCICLILRKNFRYKLILYYVLLFLLSNTHLIALLLAASVHLYFLLLQFENKRRKSELALHIMLGGLIFLSSLYFIFPPEDSEMGMQFWINRWSIQQTKAVAQLPFRAFIPIPAWWMEHYWNTEFLLEAKNNLRILKFLNVLVLLTILAVLFFILRKNRKSLVLFLTNVALTSVIIITLFPLGTARYSGFIFIGFIVAYWLSCYEAPEDTRNRWLLNVLLAFQIVAGIFVTTMDIQRPFSNANKVDQLLKEVPPDQRLVTDYWAFNVISAYVTTSFYCIDLQKEISFVKWDKAMEIMQAKPYRYFDGVTNYFQQQGIQKVYLISTGSPAILRNADPKLFTGYRVELIDKKDGAIEKGGNLYLYQINSL
jgi:hypothetical protein